MPPKDRPVTSPLAVMELNLNFWIAVGTIVVPIVIAIVGGTLCLASEVRKVQVALEHRLTKVETTVKEHGRRLDKHDQRLGTSRVTLG